MTSAAMATPGKGRTFPATIALHIVGPQFFILAPLVVQALVEDRGLSAAQANTIAFAEGMAKAVATIALAALVARVSWQHLLRVAIALLVAGNLLSALTSGFETLMAARLLTGIATGIIVPTAYATVALGERADRRFGILIATLMVYAAIAFALASRLVEWAGVSGVYVAMGSIAALTWPLIRYMPTRGETRSPADGNSGGPVPLGLVSVLAIAAVFVNFTGFLAYWVNAGVIGAAAGLPTTVIGDALAWSQLTGIAGATIVAVIGSRVGRVGPLLIGVGGQAAAIALTASATAMPQFLLAVCLFTLCQNLTHPFLLGTLAHRDSSGRLVAVGTSAQMLGVAAGPALAAVLLSQPGGLGSVQSLGAALLVLSFALVLPAASGWSAWRRGSASADAKP